MSADGKQSWAEIKTKGHRLDTSAIFLAVVSVSWKQFSTAVVCRSAVVWKPQRSASGEFVRLLRNSFTYLELIYTIFLATPIASVLIQVSVRLWERLIQLCTNCHLKCKWSLSPRKRQDHHCWGIRCSFEQGVAKCLPQNRFSWNESQQADVSTWIPWLYFQISGVLFGEGCSFGGIQSPVKLVEPAPMCYQ